jgi:polysaccharide biosynthesis/export protein
MKHSVLFVVSVFAAVTLGWAQQSVPAQAPAADSRSQSRVVTGGKDSRVAPVDGTGSGQSSISAGAPAPKDEVTGGVEGEVANYVLGPGDRLSLLVRDLDDFADQTFSVDMHGDINLPLVGRFHVAGLTVNQFEQQTATRLKKYVRDPEVVANITEYHSQSISVIGAVNAPGVHQLQGHKTLFEVLSLSGGLRSDAGSTINLTRNLRWGAIPLPDAKTDSTGQFSIASVKVSNTMTASDPSENIIIMPGDVIAVPKGQVVYAVGSVVRPGGFLLGEHDSLSSLQVLSLAEGFDKVAAPSKARILRAVPGSPNRTEIPIDLKQLMAGKAPDVPLRADDILFVPNSAAKSITKRTLDAAVQITTGVVIYGRY